MNIQEFRQKYPDYNDMSDKQIADKFYAKYYSDIDRKDFDKSFLGASVAGTEQQPPQAITAKPQEQPLADTLEFNSGLFAPEKFALETVKNVPESTANYFKNLIKGIGKIPELVDKSAMFSTDPQKIAESMEYSKEFTNSFLSGLKDRYGSWNKLASTIKNDPTGFMGDVSIFTGKVDPSRIMTEPLKAAGRKIAGQAQRVGQSALKMPTNMPLQTRTAATQQMLEQPVFKTLTGRHELAKDTIKSIEGQVADALQTADTQGLTAKTSDIPTALDAMKGQSSYAQGPNWAENAAAIEGVKERFLTNPNTVGTPFGPVAEYPLSLAQSMKKATYDDITRSAISPYEKAMKGGARGVSAETAAMQEQARTLANQVYDTLEVQYPQLRGLGKKEGATIELKRSIEKALPRIMNQELMNLGIPVGVAMGDILGGPVGAKAMLGAKMIERIPAIKASLAVALYKAGKAAKRTQGLAKLPRYAYAAGQYGEDNNNE